MSSRTAFLGTGLMGLPMAVNLVRAGYDVSAWNRTSAKAAPLAGMGARLAASPGAAVDGADIVCLMLENGPVVEDVLFGQDAASHIRPGAVVVDFSSLAPETARTNAARLAERGIAYLDAPVSGGPYGAEEASLAIMVGGEDDAVARVSDLLACCGKATHVGPSGCGQIAKLGSQMIVAGAISAVAEALLLARGSGADPAKVRQALTGGFADSKILQIHARRMLERDFEPGGHIRTHSKDLDAAIRSAEAAELNLPLTRLVHQTFRTMCDRGMGDYDHAALILALEDDNKPHRLVP